MDWLRLAWGYLRPEKSVEDLELYLEQIVKPTIGDFVRNPMSVRHAFLACVAVSHAVDYLSYPRAPRTLRQKFGEESPEFKMADEVAHAFKHVSIGPRDNPRVRAADIIPRYAGGAIGSAHIGATAIGGTDDYVTIDGHPNVRLLVVVQSAFAFLKEKASSQI